MFGNQFSLMNYDTLSTNPWNCMNLHMNQVACDMQVWPSLFQTQTYSFNNYIPYGGSYSNSYLTDPMYTIRQASWGTPAWNNNLWNNPMNGGWNWTPWGNNGIISGSSSSNSSDPEEIKHSEKYNKLKKLVEQLEKYEYLSNEEKRTLSAALKDTKGTNQEKFEKLLKAYNTIGKDKVEDFLVNANGLAVKDTSTTEGKDTSKNNFYYQLTQAGFEYKNKTMDDEVENFYNSIKNELKENGGKAVKACAVVDALDNSNILDFISSYNSNHKADALFKHIGNNWKKVKGEMATSVSSQIIDPLADKLLVVSAMVVLCTQLQGTEFSWFIPGWVIIAILCREFIVSGIRLVAVERGNVIAAGFLGKLKTATTMVAIIFLFLYQIEFNGIAVFGYIGAVMMYLALIFTILSGIEYFWKNRKVILESI